MGGALGWVAWAGDCWQLEPRRRGGDARASGRSLRRRIGAVGPVEGPVIFMAGPAAAHMRSSSRLALATQSSVRGSDAAMIMHMKGRPVRRSVG